MLVQSGTLKEGLLPFATIRPIAIRSTIILRDHRADPLQAWIDYAMGKDMVFILRFPSSILLDIYALRNAN